MSNTPPALRLLCRETPLDRNRIADDLEKRFPEDTFVKFTYVPVLRALSALDREEAHGQHGAATNRSAL